MHSREEVKKNLQTAIQTKWNHFDADTDNIDGEVYTNLAREIKNLTDLAENVADTDEALTDLQTRLTHYEQALTAAKQKNAPQEEYSEADIANLQYTISEFDNSFTKSADYFLMMSKIVLVSASDRLQLFKLKQDAAPIKQKLAQAEKALNEVIANAYRDNAEYAEQNTRDLRGKLEKAKTLSRKLTESEANFNEAEKEQKDFGYYANKELDTDSGEFFTNANDAQAKMADYFKRGASLGRVSFDLESNSDSVLRPLFTAKPAANTPVAEQIRYIPTVIKDDNNQITRCALLQYNDIQAKSFKTIVRLEDCPKNISRIRHFFTSIPGKEVMMFAHDLVENHRMMNTMYPDSVLKLNLKAAPPELAEAVILYCKHKEYPHQINGITDHTKQGQVELLRKKLANELADIGPNRLLVSKPQAIKEVLAQTESPYRPRLRA